KGVPKYLGQIPISQFREKCGFLSEDFIKSKSFKEFRRQFYKARCEILRAVGDRKQALELPTTKSVLCLDFISPGDFAAPILSTKVQAMGPCGIFLAEYTVYSMHILLTKIRTALYRATVVANARYHGDVLNLQAMGLTYSTLLSLVPFLAVMFSVLKAFGIQNGLEPVLARLLQPLGYAASHVTKT